ncbi:MAG: beta-propeller domain-containing protein, partial [Candidatus Peregrinibacteria bacterium]
MKVRKFISGVIFGALLFGAVGVVSVTGESVVTSFTDVKEWTPSYTAVDYLRENGMVVGYSDGNFGVDRNINRAEFLKIVMEAGNYETGGKNCYPDVKDQWFAEYVCKATELGLVEGYPDGTFKPEQEINFVEASKIVVNALEMEPAGGGENWFDTYVYSLEAADAIPGEVSGFDQKLTRGEMADISWRVMNDRTYKLSNTYENVAAGVAVDERSVDLMNFESCTELSDYIEDNADVYTDYWGWGDDVLIEEADAPAAMSKESGAEMGTNGGGLGADEYSSTNVQVENVDEADIVKNDGKYVYYLRGEEVRIVDAYPPDQMEEVSKVTFDESFWPSEMYVDDDRMIIIGTTYDDTFTRDVDYYYSSSVTKIYIYNIKDRSNPELLREVSFEGSYSDSRKVGDEVYLVMNQYNYYQPLKDGEMVQDYLVPRYSDNGGKIKPLVGCADVRYLPAPVNSTDYLIVASVPVDDANGRVDKEVVLGSSASVYSSTENLYVVEPRYKYYWWYDESGDREETYIHKFSLNNGDMDYEGMGRVPGTVLNQFSMDESGDYFRIATTVGGWWEGSPVNNMYVLDQNLEVVGALEGLAPGERIYSARFVGDRAYMVTFEQIDPLFVIDLSKPASPSVLGELHIPGVSDYLHPFGENYLIGFGLDTVSEEVMEAAGWSWFQGIKMSMFDVSDVNNPVEVDKVTIGDRGSSSELLYNHKALLFDEGKGIMAFPVVVAEIPEKVKADLSVDDWVYGDYTFQGAYVYKVSEDDGFEYVGRISHYADDELGNDFEYYYYYSDVLKNIDRI